MKVMIVEDDMLVRLGVKSMIPWTELGLEIVGEARDGIEALDIFAKQLPDIALVDIGLPKLSGLAFIEQAKGIYPECEYIILTCNQDFDMVRQSLRLEVRDFILKSTMEIETLRQVIENVVGLMNKKREKQSNDQHKLGAQSFKTLQKKEFMREWLNGNYVQSDVIAKKAAENGLDVQGAELQAWVIQLDTPYRKGQKLLPHDLDKLGYAIENIARELYRESLVGVVEDVRIRRWYILVDQATNHTDPNALVRAVDHYLDYQISMGCSRTFTDLSCWPRSEAEASSCLELKYYKPNQSVFEYEADSQPAWCTTIPTSIVGIEKEIHQWLSLFQFEKAAQSLRMLEQELGTPPYVLPGTVKNLIIDILNKLSDVCGNRESTHRKPDMATANEVLEPVYFQDSLKGIDDEIQMLLAQFGENRLKAEKRMIIEAVESYIHETPHLEMNLNEIAENLKVSAAYLSRTFKEETGNNFTEFVLDIKVKKAVNMMENGMGVTETAERLGYLNVSSFTRMFKKRVGVAPSQFVK
ncbi:helix-turn-helix domain-containing protein [Paenibacillus nasutitermitis]|uniref:Response regulator n=1 Tax=Paenibacillus nasutitermitis TaxID=1652958 RepID=A0A917E206_9BACL|nr:helix-turn-helix domain-containing protein [Paenibacillus nasutitermitis]GGD96778.1 hypothetical protein GCM10010911_64430 [Paenibacillus nasutitermitis]